MGRSTNREWRHRCDFLPNLCIVYCLMTPAHCLTVARRSIRLLELVGLHLCVYCMPVSYRFGVGMRRVLRTHHASLFPCKLSRNKVLEALQVVDRGFKKGQDSLSCLFHKGGFASVKRRTVNQQQPDPLMPIDYWRKTADAWQSAQGWW